MNDVEALRTLTAQLKPDFPDARCVDDRYILLKMPLRRLAVIYLLNVNLPVGVIKRTIRDNTAQGIHSLFALHVDLLPADGALLRLPPLLNILQILYHGQVYGYRLAASGISIFPLQLRAVDSSATRRVVYGESVEWTEMICDQLEAGYPVAGFWATVNFRQSVDWEPSTYNYQRNSSSNPIHNRQINLRRWCRVLGVDMDADEAQVRRAYRELARQYHPDRNTSPDATDRMQEINQAYKALMNHLT